MPNVKDIAVKEPKPGDTRKVNRVFKKDEVLSFAGDPEKYRLPYDITMDVTEEFEATKYGEGVWKLKNYFTGSAQPVPTLWQRFWRWLHVPASTLPTATLVKE